MRMRNAICVVRQALPDGANDLVIETGRQFALTVTDTRRW